MKPKIALLGCLIPIILAACNNVGETFHLQADESYDGGQYLVVVDVDIEEGSTVDGDLGITAADEVNINGHVDGDLTVVAKRLSIGPDAEINGDLTYCVVRDGDVNIDDDAIIWGEMSDSCTDARLQVSLSSDDNANYFLRFLGNGAMALSVGLLAALGTIFFPAQLSSIRRAAYRQGLSSTMLGLLTLVVATGLFLLWRASLGLGVPVIMAPGVVIAWITLIVLSGIGVISVAQPLGRWLLRRLRCGEQVPLVTTTVGAASLVFFLLSFRIVPSLAFITIGLALLVTSWALGAVLLTRAGTR